MSMAVIIWEGNCRTEGTEDTEVEKRGAGGGLCGLVRFRFSLTSVTSVTSVRVCLKFLVKGLLGGEEREEVRGEGGFEREWSALKFEREAGSVESLSGEKELGF